MENVENTKCYTIVFITAKTQFYYKYSHLHNKTSKKPTFKTIRWPLALLSRCCAQRTVLVSSGWWEDWDQGRGRRRTSKRREIAPDLGAQCCWEGTAQHQRRMQAHSAMWCSGKQLWGSARAHSDLDSLHGCTALPGHVNFLSGPLFNEETQIIVSEVPDRPGI